MFCQLSTFVHTHVTAHGNENWPVKIGKKSWQIVICLIRQIFFHSNVKILHTAEDKLIEIFVAKILWFILFCVQGI